MLVRVVRIVIRSLRHRLHRLIRLRLMPPLVRKLPPPGPLPPPAALVPPPAKRRILSILDKAKTALDSSYGLHEDPYFDE